MSHLSVRLLIEETVKGIDDSIQFGYGRASDFNSILKKGSKAVHLDTLSSTLAYTEESYNLTRIFSPAIIFYKLDKKEGAEKETADILDITDKDAIKFLQVLNLKTTDLDQDIQISSIRTEPVIKVTADFMTGIILRFDLTVPDDFNYCIDD